MKTLEQLEREVEREARLLDALPPAEMPPEVLVRLKARVRGEAAGAASAARFNRLRRWGVVAAAAAALIAGFVYPPATSIDADAEIKSWLVAMDASSSDLVAAADVTRPSPEWRTDDDANKELQNWSDSLEASFDRFGAL